MSSLQLQISPIGDGLSLKARTYEALRAAIDRLQQGDAPFRIEPAWMAELNKVSEGQSHTLGAYYRPWK